MLDTTLFGENNPVGGGEENVSLAPAKDPSNAERQRRYRERKRNVTRVTRNAVTVTDVTRNADVRSVTDRDSETAILPAQAQMTLAFTDDGDLILRQACPLGGDDSVIVIAYENIGTFLDRLCDAAGVVGYKP